MEFKDYYATLGVAPDADDKTIKDTYRKLARQYHPDVNPGDKRAEARFKEINEAYQALSDPEKRRKYDALREEYQRFQAGGGSRPQGAPGGGGFDWSAWQAAPGEHGSTQNLSPEDLEDLFGEAGGFSDFFGSIYGQPRTSRPPRPRRGRDLEVLTEVTLEEAFHGTRRMIEVGDRRIEARIPPGVQTGSRVRLAGQGSPGAAGGPAGDLYLVIEVTPHAQFAREGDDLHCDVPVDLFTAAAGGEARVQTLDGAVMLKIPARTQAGKTFRLRGKGMPRLEQSTERGDLYVHAKLVLPEPLSDDELEALRSLRDARQRR